MSLLIRKIEKAKWLQNDIINGQIPSADAITNCTKTSRNTLSTWEIDSVSNINNAVIALLCGQEHLDTIDIVYFEPEKISERGISIEATEGRTSFAIMKEKHRNLSQLDYEKLGTIAEIIIEEIKSNRDVRFSVGKQKEILRQAIKNGLISIESLNIGISDKLKEGKDSV